MDFVESIQGVPLVDSWVKTNKLKNTKGSGEAKLKIPDRVNIDDFFDQNLDNCYFGRKNLYEYLKSASEIYIIENFNFRNEKMMREQFFEYLDMLYYEFNSLNLKFEIYIPEVKRRKYVNSRDRVYEYVRNIVIPRKSTVDIHKLKNNDGEIYYSWEIYFNR